MSGLQSYTRPYLGERLVPVAYSEVSQAECSGASPQEAGTGLRPCSAIPRAFPQEEGAPLSRAGAPPGHWDMPGAERCSGRQLVGGRLPSRLRGGEAIRRSLASDAALVSGAIKVPPRAVDNYERLAGSGESEAAEAARGGQGCGDGSPASSEAGPGAGGHSPAPHCHDCAQWSGLGAARPDPAGLSGSPKAPRRLALTGKRFAASGSRSDPVGTESSFARNHGFEGKSLWRQSCRPSNASPRAPLHSVHLTSEETKC